MSRAGSRLLRSAERARAYARGEATEGFVAHVPANVDVRAIRNKLGLTQDSFALRFGFSPAAVRDWEQGRRQPEQAARVLLLVIDHNPKAVLAALEKAVQRCDSRQGLTAAAE
jgi:putative transcriptional regulator